MALKLLAQACSVLRCLSWPVLDLCSLSRQQAAGTQLASAENRLMPDPAQVQSQIQLLLWVC